MILILLLVAVAGAVWIDILGRTNPETLDCPAPVQAPGAAQAGAIQAHAALDGVPPAPPQLVRVQVLNGNGERGEAAIVDAGLTDLGFVHAAEPANDPLHPAFDLTCHGQIRYGDAGTTAARTLSLVVPCAELMRDGRPGDVVDLALGTEFTEFAASQPVRDVLTSLVELGSPAAEPEEGGQGGQAAAPVQPTLDADTLAAARDVDCSPAT
ncbi:MAG: envelope integrity protein Cei [Actinomycetota bacterium]|nr:envelope integrity protein Cei [Actinomycetota bacterium]